MITLRSATLLLALLSPLLPGCPHSETPVTPNGGVDCEAACSQARAICAAQPCDEATSNLFAPTPDGKPCETWRCQQGYPHEKNACLARATVPSELAACRGVGK